MVQPPRAELATGASGQTHLTTLLPCSSSSETALLLAAEQRQQDPFLQAPGTKRHLQKGQSREETLLLLNDPARAPALAPSHCHWQWLSDTATKLSHALWAALQH